MTGRNPKNLVAGNLAYHDYIFMLCAVDAEWSRKRVSYKASKSEVFDSFLAIHRHFTTRCLEYANGINMNYRKFCKANKPKSTEPLAPYLFNPVCFLPFGHADGLIFTLLDDFDPVHRLTSQIKTTIEEVNLAFCPRFESFHIEDPNHVFCEPHELFGRKPKVPQKKQGKSNEYEPALHEIQKSTPLMAFTKYKMHGLANVGQGLLFQQILFKAMANTIQETITKLRKRFVTDDSVNCLMEEEDPDFLKCTFLDLQGPEEIGTLIFCRNYTVAMTLVLALKSLTFGAIFDTDNSGNIEKLLNCCPSHLAIIRLNHRNVKKEVPPKVDLLRDNHVFKWTHTTLTVSPQMFLGSLPRKYNGYVEALAEFQIEPGHHKIEEEIITVPTKHTKRIKKVLDKVKYYRSVIGMWDIIAPYTSSTSDNQSRLLPIEEAFSIVAQNLCKFSRCRKKFDYGRDVVNTATTLIIPVPKFVNNIGTKKHLSLFAGVLRGVQKRLCYFNDFKHAQRALGPRSGKLDLGELKRIPRLYGVPVSLRRAVEYLYQNFATLVADPFLFDTILDLYDTFATLHKLLTKHLWSIQQQRSRHTLGNPSILDSGIVKQIAMLVTALHDALVHRMSKAYPEAQVRDMAIDFHGGLNQVLFAADAPVKCGLALLRKYALEGRAMQRDTVGAPMCVGFAPGAKCYSLMFGTEDKVKLAYFEVDVPHFLHVPRFCDNLHETFHLIFDTLRHRPGSKIGKFRFLSPVMEDRVSEIFANLMAQIFIFGPDVRKFLCYHISNYSQNIISVGLDEGGTVAKFTELLIQLFLVTDAVPSKKEPRCWSDKWIRKGDDTDTVLSRFKKMVNSFGFFFSEYERLWNGSNKDDVRFYCWEQFKDIYPEVSEYMPHLWSESLNIYNQFVHNELCREDNSYEYNDRKIRAYIRRGLDNGKPIIGSLYHFSYYNKDFSDDGFPKTFDNIGINPIFLVCNILYEYLPSVEDLRGKAIHLYRRPGDMKVNFPKQVKFLKKRNQLWSEFLLDKGDAARFCPVPLARRMRVKRQVTILKTLWGISSILREQRLWEIISDNFEEAAKLFTPDKWRCW